LLNFNLFAVVLVIYDINKMRVVRKEKKNKNKNKKQVVEQKKVYIP
jgi:hypothetical protein